MEKSLVFLLLLICLLSEGPGKGRPPKFCTLEAAWSRVADQQLIGAFANPDTLLEHELYLLSDSTGQPLLFYSDILTPVCIDGTCKPVYIELYWDLTGQYAGYGLYPEQPLTKFDHEEFLPADEEKLHRLLADNNSVLRRKQLSELFDDRAAEAKKIEYQGQELDAVSGATKKEIKASIIEGALYSCYTLWYLVHGEATRLMGDHLETIYDTELETAFLEATHEPYYYYALQRMETTDFPVHADRLAELFAVARPLTRTYLLKKMPDKVLKDKAICQLFYKLFTTVDINARTLLLQKLPEAHPVAMELLSAQVQQMSRNQLKIYLEALPSDRSALPAAVTENLQSAARSQAYAYGYLIQRWW